MADLGEDILGLWFAPADAGGQGEIEGVMDLLIELRQKLRGQRNFELADQIRARLTDLGLQLKDEKDGTTWTRL